MTVRADERPLHRFHADITKRWAASAGSAIGERVQDGSRAIPSLVLRSEDSSDATLSLERWGSWVGISNKRVLPRLQADWRKCLFVFLKWVPREASPPERLSRSPTPGAAELSPTNVNVSTARGRPHTATSAWQERTRSEEELSIQQTVLQITFTRTTTAAEPLGWCNNSFLTIDVSLWIERGRYCWSRTGKNVPFHNLPALESVDFTELLKNSRTRNASTKPSAEQNAEKKPPPQSHSTLPELPGKRSHGLGWRRL